MGCYRVYAYGQSADLHKITYELETSTQTLKIEPEESVGPSRDRISGYLHQVDAVVRLGQHACAPDPFTDNFASLNQLYCCKGGRDGCNGAGATGSHETRKRTDAG